MQIASLERAMVGYPITRNGVSLTPVNVHQHHPHIATGANAGVVIEERPDASVPTLVVRNDAPVPVLLVEGETVVGGYQNRVLNVSVLVPAATTLEIPVSCVEQGRWGGAAGRFERGSTFASRRVRAAKVRTVAEGLRHDGAKRSDQGQVWSAVRSELERLGLRHDTGSLTAADGALETDARLAAATEELVSMGPLPGQCGVVVSHGSRIIAADVFADPDTFACHWEAIVRAHMLDAPSQVVGTPSATKALRFLRRFAVATDRVAPGVGLGREHHVATAKMAGQALVWDGVLVHASAFAVAA